MDFFKDVIFPKSSVMETPSVEGRKDGTCLSSRRNVLICAAVGCALVIAAALVGTSFANKKNLRRTTDEEKQSEEAKNVEIPEGFSAVPNINLVFQGYDLMKGNPVPTSGDGSARADPGYTQPIFTESYSQLQMAGEDLIVPDGVDYLNVCSGNCKLDFSSRILETTKEYHDRLGIKVSAKAEGKGWGVTASFSASSDFETVTEKTSDLSTTVIQSEASCCSYDVEIQHFTPPSFHPSFRAALSTLTDDYDEQVYDKFVQIYGTHYVSKATMGAIVGEQSFISIEKRTELEMDSVSLEVLASASGYGASVEAGVQTEMEKRMAETFKNSTTNRRLYSIGVLPPPGGIDSAWEESVQKSPGPTTIEVTRIDSLDLPVSPAVKSNLGLFLDNYCTKLVEDGVIGSCEPPAFGFSKPQFLPSPPVNIVAQRPALCQHKEFGLGFMTGIVPYFAFKPNLDRPSSGSTFYSDPNDGVIGHLKIECSNGSDRWLVDATDRGGSFPYTVGRDQNPLFCKDSDSGKNTPIIKALTERRSLQPGDAHIRELANMIITCQHSVKSEISFIKNTNPDKADPGQRWWSPNDHFCEGVNRVVVGLQVQNLADPTKGVSDIRLVCEDKDKVNGL